jgi:hypothetical protein
VNEEILIDFDELTRESEEKLSQALQMLKERDEEEKRMKEEQEQMRHDDLKRMEEEARAALEA